MSDIPQLRYDAVRATLRQRGVTHVVVGYNGGGDSGGIETVDAFAADGSSVTLSPEHEKIFERVADNVMPNTGWWNGPGGYGTISFDLATADAHLTHYEYTDRNTTVEYEFGPEKLSKWVQEQFTGAPNLKSTITDCCGPIGTGRGYPPDSGWNEVPASNHVRCVQPKRPSENGCRL
jgi:hypothetical protein